MHDKCTAVINLCIKVWELFMVRVEKNMKNSPAEEIESTFWSMFDILRGKVDMSGSYILLLYLSLYKDDLLSKVYTLIDGDFAPELAQRFAKEYANKLPENKKELSKSYDSIIQGLFNSLGKIDEPEIFKIVEKLEEIDRATLSENFPEIFDNILYKIVQSQGRYGGEFIQPIELTRFICALSDLPDQSSVFNPFAGLASFGVFLDQSQDYFGQELNRKTWALGALRLMAYSRPVLSKYVCDDSILHWPEKQKFDLIVANPPFGAPLKQQDQIQNSGIRTYEQFLIEKGISSLKSNGKLIAVLPNGILFRGGTDLRLREILIENDLIDTIISFPGGVLLNTGIPFVVLVLNKSKNLPGQVRFIEANKFVKSEGARVKVLNEYSINSLIKSNKESDFLRVVSNHKIQENNYNLDVHRYYQKGIIPEKNERLVKLKVLMEYVRGQSGDLPESGKLVRIRDLKDDNVDYRLDLSIIERTLLRRPDIYQLNDTCLLLAIRWRTLKPTLFKYDGEPIFRNQDILSFKVDESIVDITYLINELHSEYVQEQLEAYRMGTTIPIIRKDDLCEVVIKLPPLEEQRAKVQGIIELSDKIKILQEERNALAHGVSNKLYESVSTIKHSLGKPLLNIGSSLRNIEKALSRLNVDWEQAKINERYDITLKDTFESIHSNLEFIHSVLRNNESALDVTNYELKEVDFLNFIKGYVKRIKSAERSNININLDFHPDIKIQLNNKVTLKANTELLEIAMNAIVENAYMHAFTDHSKKYKLEFRVSLYVAPSVKAKSNDTASRFDTFIKMEVANNGKSFPANYSIEKFTRRNSFAGETGNTGQGGFDLNEIIKYHNEGKSTLELIIDDFNTEFTTTYSFLIPLTR